MRNSPKLTPMGTDIAKVHQASAELNSNGHRECMTDRGNNDKSFLISKDRKVENEAAGWQVIRQACPIA
jgi:hypothetical protein